MAEEGGWWSKVVQQTGKAWHYTKGTIIDIGKCYMCLNRADLDINCGHILCSPCLAYWIESQGDTKLDQIPCYICGKIIAVEFTQIFSKIEKDFNNLEEEKVPARRIPQETIPNNNIQPPSGSIFTQPHKKVSKPSQKREAFGIFQDAPNPVPINNPQKIKAVNESQAPQIQEPLNKESASDDSIDSQKINETQFSPFPNLLNEDPVNNPSEENKEELNKFQIPPMPGLFKKDSDIDSSREIKAINKFQIPSLPNLLTNHSEVDGSSENQEINKFKKPIIPVLPSNDSAEVKNNPPKPGLPIFINPPPFLPISNPPQILNEASRSPQESEIINLQLSSREGKKLAEKKFKDLAASSSDSSSSDSESSVELSI